MSSAERRMRRLQHRNSLATATDPANTSRPVVTTDAPKRVAVLTPCGDMVHIEFAVSVQQMLIHTFAQRDPRISEIGVFNYGSSILPFSRHVLATAALEQGWTHTLWIDSDMMFPRDIIVQFLNRDKPIVGINAMSRRTPYRLTAQRAPGIPLGTWDDSTGLEKAHRIGFGVVWIATEVYERVPKPWFEFEFLPDMNCYRGEDYYFFEKAREAGYEILVDHDLSKQVQHMGTFGFHPGLVDSLTPAEYRPAR